MNATKKWEVNQSADNEKVFDEGGSLATPKPLVNPFSKRQIPIKPQNSVGADCSKKSCSFSTRGSFDKNVHDDGHRLSDSGSTRLQELIWKNQAPEKELLLQDGKDVSGEGASQSSGRGMEKVSLSETETIWLLDIKSKAVPQHLLLDKVMATTEAKEEVTNGLDKNMKHVDSKTQTMNLQTKQKSTMTTPIQTQDVECEATCWDLHDSFLSQDNEPVVHVNPKHISPKSGPPGEAKANKGIVLHSAMVMERLLASNNYKHQQAIGNQCPAAAQTDEEIKLTRFQYELCSLWSHQCATTKNKSVMHLSWNPTNPIILAVGYGQYLISEEKKGGLVCCWSVKNPTQPERTYSFEYSVTALTFSSSNSRLLVVGLQNGAIIVLDVSQTQNKPFTQTDIKDGGHVGAIWSIKSVNWSGQDVIVTAGEDGQILLWTFGMGFYKIANLKIQVPINLICIDSCNENDICCEAPIQQHHSNLDISLSTFDEKNPTLYVATKEGYIIEVEMELKTRNARKVHLGPVYRVQVSPFCPKLVLTAGADGKVHLWAQSNEHPVLSLSISAVKNRLRLVIHGTDRANENIFQTAVIGAEWSPSFSTILACASGTFLSLWDVARKTHEPVTRVNLSCQLTSLIFSPDGKNILVGDRAGRVHVFSLQDMPWPPMMQEEALLKVLPGFTSV